MAKIIAYEHHNKVVSVQEDLKGKHREHCLCWQNCKHFKPSNRDENCETANELFALLCREDVPVLVAPVWECSKYEQ